MAYNTQLADRVREYLAQFPELDIEEKKMFRGLAFLINGKMCINVSGENLMCRFDPDQTQFLADRTGFLPMIMKGKEYKGYCYVEPRGFTTRKNFEFWMNLCLDFNARAKASKKRTKR
jgi:hypothetical protein